jgi:hypothetical protein
MKIKVRAKRALYENSMDICQGAPRIFITRPTRQRADKMKFGKRVLKGMPLLRSLERY